MAVCAIAVPSHDDPLTACSLKQQHDVYEYMAPPLAYVESSSDTMTPRWRKSQYVERAAGGTHVARVQRSDTAGLIRLGVAL